MTQKDASFTNLYIVPLLRQRCQFNIVFVLFYSIECGTQDKDTELLAFTSETVPQASGYDDHDVDTELNSRVPACAQKQKTILDDMDQMSNKRNQTTSEFVSTVKSLVASSAPQNAVRLPPFPSSALISEMNALIRQLNKLGKPDDDCELTKQSISFIGAALGKHSRFANI